MPELPEVEFARRTIAGVLNGAKVEAAQGEDALVVPGGARALAALVGARGKAVERRGKQLRLVLEKGGDEVLAFAHLGMTGDWVAAKPGDAPLRFEKLRIDVTKGKTRASLRYVDARRLGRFVVAREDTRAWKALGPDALADGVDAKALHAKLAARKVTVKEALLDQRLLAGVGNILAIEALWRAQIDPRSRTDALTLVDVRAIARGIRTAIAVTLRAHERDGVGYVNAGAPNPFRIYGHAGKPCPRCGAKLAKIVLGGRGTTFCPSCQRRVA